ncbi:MAG: phosphatidate cytidylyltransferase [Bacteroidetes bacterium]|nr:phosphatidate cytidylyltransferase [Bacteroidota bacterium]
MKIINLIPALTLFMLSTLLTSCGVVEGIFKAGMGFGIFIVVAIIAVIIFLVMKAGKK